MSKDKGPAPPPVGAVTVTGRWIGAALGVPAAILLHQVGHATAVWVFGLPDPTIHHTSASFEGQERFWMLMNHGNTEAAETIAPAWQMGFVAGGGIMISYLAILLGCGLMHWNFRAFFGSLAIAAAFRIIPVSTAMAAGSMAHTDEARVALATGAADIILVVFGWVGLLAALFGVFKGAPESGVGGFARDLVIGMVIGTLAYLGGVGPALLP